MPDNRLEYLFQRYLNGDLTGEENGELTELIQQPDYDDAIKTLLNTVWAQLTIEERISADKADALFATILSSNPVNPIPMMPMDERRPRRLFKRMAVAAAVLVLVATGGWLFYLNRSTPPVATTNPGSIANDIPPGKNNAILILADGRRINLDSTANGELARQEGNVTITKKEGMVVYDATDRQSTIDNKQLAIQYNTISTARGNQYKLILPDGSAVWLNAESTVRFPVAFTGKERRVEVTGEVYVEVKHNAAMPFTVVANGVEVHDIGTEFNVNSYDGSIVTTVVEGKVSVDRGQAESPKQKAQSQLAVPGQQVTVSNGELKLEKNADVDAAIAWKNGQFMFAGSSIQVVMRQLERWYDVEVSYAPNVSKEEFVGTMTRYANISSVLKMLEKTGTVRFEIQGRKVIVK